MKAHVECKVGLRAFKQLKAYYVRRLKECNTCACKYHIERVELQHGFNNMRTTSKGVHGRMCPCSYNICKSEIPRECNVKRTQFLGFINMWNSIRCPLEPNFIWHNLVCLKGKCLDCGTNMLMTCPFKEDKHLALHMQWKCYELMVHGKTRVGKDNKVLQLRYKETTTKMFLDYLRPKLKRFVLHNYVFKFQEEQYNICLNTFPPTFILSIMDFAKNYSLQWLTNLSFWFFYIPFHTLQKHIELVVFLLHTPYPYAKSKYLPFFYQECVQKFQHYIRHQCFPPN
jgi:hypothetical protein